MLPEAILQADLEIAPPAEADDEPVDLEAVLGSAKDPFGDDSE